MLDIIYAKDLGKKFILYLKPNVNYELNTTRKLNLGLRHWQRKLDNFEREGAKNWGYGGYPLENSSVLVQLFTEYGQFCYFS